MGYTNNTIDETSLRMIDYPAEWTKNTTNFLMHNDIEDTIRETKLSSIYYSPKGY